jgi:Uma2 family endonuclease
MSRVAVRSRMTPQEYLAWEREQPERHEYFHGEVFAMAGGSYRHNALSGQLLMALNGALRKRGCFAMTSDTRVGLGDRYVYPDVTVVCGERRSEPGTTDVLVNPSILIEVLSSGTESYDRGLKWERYQRIASLSDYLLVAQARVQIEQFQRNSDGSWTYRTFGPGDRITLATGDAIEVDAIYADVFQLEGEEPAPL